MSHCPCCGYSLLRNTRGNKVYWFCDHCWQEMPNFEELRALICRPSLDKKIEISGWIPEEELSSTSKKLSKSKKYLVCDRKSEIVQV